MDIINARAREERSYSEHGIILNMQERRQFNSEHNFPSLWFVFGAALRITRTSALTSLPSRCAAGSEERRKRKRAAIGARPALGTVAPRSGGFGGPASCSSGTGTGRTAASIGVLVGRSPATAGAPPAATAATATAASSATTAATTVTAETDTGAERFPSPAADPGSVSPGSATVPGSSGSSSTPAPAPAPAADQSQSGPADLLSGSSGQPDRPEPNLSPRLDQPTPTAAVPTTGRLSLVAEYSSTDSE